jgi:hypothetical protein
MVRGMDKLITASTEHRDDGAADQGSRTAERPRLPPQFVTHLIASDPVRAGP